MTVSREALTSRWNMGNSASAILEFCFRILLRMQRHSYDLHCQALPRTSNLRIDDPRLHYDEWIWEFGLAREIQCDQALRVSNVNVVFHPRMPVRALGDLRWMGWGSSTCVHIQGEHENRGR